MASAPDPAGRPCQHQTHGPSAPSINPANRFAMNLDSADQAANLSAEAAALGAEVGRSDGKAAEGSGGTAILVLGMHRSGTSSLAGAMTRLGGAAPGNLIPGDEANPKGYWESAILNTLNEDILAAAGSR